MEGSDADVNKMMEELRVGPLSADVDDVEIEEKEFTGEYKYFRILFE